MDKKECQGKLGGDQNPRFEAFPGAGKAREEVAKEA